MHLSAEKVAHNSTQSCLSSRLFASLCRGPRGRSYQNCFRRDRVAFHMPAGSIRPPIVARLPSTSDAAVTVCLGVQGTVGRAESTSRRPLPQERQPLRVNRAHDAKTGEALAGCWRVFPRRSGGVPTEHGEDGYPCLRRETQAMCRAPVHLSCPPFPEGWHTLCGIAATCGAKRRLSRRSAGASSVHRAKAKDKVRVAPHLVLRPRTARCARDARMASRGGTSRFSRHVALLPIPRPKNGR
jgi:hypothetical protein